LFSHKKSKVGKNSEIVKTLRNLNLAAKVGSPRVEKINLAKSRYSKLGTGNRNLKNLKKQPLAVSSKRLGEAR
jgi:hypothetical protein